MRRLLTSALLCLVLVIGLTIPALAQGSATIKRVVDSGELRVGMSGTQPPFSVKSKEGKLIGYEVDLANMLADAMGAKAKIVEIPFGKLLDSLENGEVDVVMSGMTMTPRRNARVAFVGPYIVSGKSILTKDSTLAALEEAEELDKSSISLVASGELDEPEMGRALDAQRQAGHRIELRRRREHGARGQGHGDGRRHADRRHFGDASSGQRPGDHGRASEHRADRDRPGTWRLAAAQHGRELPRCARGPRRIRSTREQVVWRCLLDDQRSVVDLSSPKLYRPWSLGLLRARAVLLFAHHNR